MSLRKKIILGALLLLTLIGVGLGIGLGLYFRNRPKVIIQQLGSSILYQSSENNLLQFT
jgi:hypothetical protein